jgi:hypothetical protein
MFVESVDVASSPHPLAGMGATERTEARWRAIGQVLAEIAKRRCVSEEQSFDQPSPSASEPEVRERCEVMTCS